MRSWGRRGFLSQEQGWAEDCSQGAQEGRPKGGKKDKGRWRNTCSGTTSVKFGVAWKPSHATNYSTPLLMEMRQWFKIFLPQRAWSEVYSSPSSVTSATTALCWPQITLLNLHIHLSICSYHLTTTTTDCPNHKLSPSIHTFQYTAPCTPSRPSLQSRWRTSSGGSRQWRLRVQMVSAHGQLQMNCEGLLNICSTWGWNWGDKSGWHPAWYLSPRVCTLRTSAATGQWVWSFTRWRHWSCWFLPIWPPGELILWPVAVCISASSIKLCLTWKSLGALWGLCSLISPVLSILYSLHSWRSSWNTGADHLLTGWIVYYLTNRPQHLWTWDCVSERVVCPTRELFWLCSVSHCTLQTFSTIHLQKFSYNCHHWPFSQIGTTGCTED